MSYGQSEQDFDYPAGAAQRVGNCQLLRSSPTPQKNLKVAVTFLGTALRQDRPVLFILFSAVGMRAMNCYFLVHLDLTKKLKSSLNELQSQKVMGGGAAKDLRINKPQREERHKSGEGRKNN